MTNLRISDLPQGTTAIANDVFPFTYTNGSETQSIRADDLGVALARLGLRVGSGTPLSPANGDLWVDTTTNPPVLKVYNGASFTTVSFLPGSSVATSPGTTAPSGNPIPTGKLWLDTSQNPVQLKVYNGTDFDRVDPLGITEGAGDARYLQIADALTTYLGLGGGTLTGDLTLNGDPSTTNMAANKNYVDTQIAAIPAVDPVPAGTVIWYAGQTAPTGYLAAYGQEVLKEDYQNLWLALSIPGANNERTGIYGSPSDSDYFALPDLRGQFVRGVDEPPGTSSPRGKDSGRQMGSDQGDQNKQHNHTITGGSFSYVSAVSLNQNINAVDNSPDDVEVLNTDTSLTVTPGTYTPPTAVNNDGGTEARPTNIALLGCIKT
jgi:microcystin-dependent protein